MSDCRKPGGAFWATIAAVIVVVAYPLSAGPVFWLDQRHLVPESGRKWPIFAPLGWLSDTMPPFGRVWTRDISLWLP